MFIPFLLGCPAEDIEAAINRKVLEEINQRRDSSATTLLSYGQFKQLG